MTDTTLDGASALPETDVRATIRNSLKSRRRKQTRLRLYGLAAILFALAMLAVLIGSVIITSLPAWTQTQVRIDVTVPPEAAEGANVRPGPLADASILALFPDVENRPEKRAVTSILSNGAQYSIRDTLEAGTLRPGETLSIWVPVSDPYEQLREGVITRDQPENRRPLNDAEIERFEQLEADGRVRSAFAWDLFTSSDSRFPEIAGLRGAIVGSFYLLLICLVVSVPLGVGAAVYLEEYASKNKFTDFIEINVNNLAAVPSVVFGLLGLALFIGFFGMPRSVPLVGGLVLALMTLPTIIITTRSALKAVPPSIREAARGVGASDMQVIGHHVLPLAAPGIMTGVIIGLAQALGETAPLLLIGMNAFIVSAPGGILEASTALPTQIFIWFDSPERGFVARTSAAICVLLIFLSLMNITAIILRRRFERRW